MIQTFCDLCEIRILNSEMLYNISIDKFSLDSEDWKNHKEVLHMEICMDCKSKVLIALSDIKSKFFNIRKVELKTALDQLNKIGANINPVKEEEVLKLMLKETLEELKKQGYIFYPTKDTVRLI